MSKWMSFLYLLLLVFGSALFGQEDARELGTRLQELHEYYKPQSMLRLKQHPVEKARFPVSDVHCHWDSTVSPETLIQEMDLLGISYAVNLSGGWGNQLEQMLSDYQRYAPHRFKILASVDFSEVDELDFAEKWVRFLERAKSQGVAGLKVFKSLGLVTRDKSGRVISIDDPRLDPIWEKCGELDMPVLIHSADPLAFFEPIDRLNERVMQLGRHPEWSFYGEQFPSRDEVILQRNRVVERHPGTTFIGAHMGGGAEDLSSLGLLLDRLPNLFVDITGRVAELGRQPYTARKFFLKYQDRILFGTDRYPGGTNQPRHRIYFQFLETADEYFDYYRHDFPPTGEWKIYGIFLPDEVLRKIYHLNADKIFRK